ncbi:MULTISPECIES: hypothetical protein [Halorussus]|uniref:hypothetical protein n=1 Tax=Halorussus TaxID=1070314 RepID=UPI000E21476A|nr:MULTISPECIES: hypothetical protein [Halorussus]NHN61632.1 hypothetical protein [Halorussus sp. JP-T4]
MSDEPPTPPSELPADVVERLDGYSPEHLRHIASYAEELAEHREREARLAAEAGADEAGADEAGADEAEADEVGEEPEDLPDDVPSRATITIKEINDNRYYYWQWREGDTVTSKYKGPVDSDG